LIPKEWRIDELNKKVVVQKDFYITYLESYGPLSLLLYLRTQNLLKDNPNSNLANELSHN